MSNNYINPASIQIPSSFTYDEDLNVKSAWSIGEYNILIENCAINPNGVLFLFSSKEAETTTRLEGTNVVVEDIILEEGTTEKHVHEKSSVGEAMAVFDAIHEGRYLLEKQNIPFSNRVIKAMHKKLMLRALIDQGVPGEFRKEIVSVGNRYFPPEPQHISDLMSDLEKFIYNDVSISPIVKIAVVHAQFEIIHPFADGNGRIGRLLIPFLMNTFGLTERVSYYISPHFEKNKEEYFKALENITKHNDWTSWINFFLRSVIEHGEEMKEKINLLIDLYKDGNFLKLKSASSQHIKNYIFQKPFFTVPQMIIYFEKKGIPLLNKNSLHKILKDSSDIMVSKTGKGRRETRYWCPKIARAISKQGA